jgi:proteasome accessory factor B
VVQSVSDGPAPDQTRISLVPTTKLRIPVEERLFSLVLALLATESGLTKDEILSTVQGYRQEFTRSGTNRSLERKFERDKDDIRELGVPLETIDSPGDPGNNQTARYRIPRGAYELPSDITFTSEEIALLALASMVWREGSLSAESRRAVLKIRSLGGTAAEPVLGYAPRLQVRDLAFEPLRFALEKHVIARFAYLKPGEQIARLRSVAPLALVQHQGRWHLYAREPDSGLTKTFLLRRIVSSVETTKIPFDTPAADQTAQALAELDVLWLSQTAEIEVQKGSDAASRLGNRRGTTVAESGTLEIHYSDINIVADELAGYGPEVLVLSPPELRMAVVSRLERTAEIHG